MTDKLKEVINREMAKLPKESREAISSLNWATITEGIGKKYLLSEAEINDLQVQTLLVLISLERPDFYAINIENEVGTSKNEANKITEEVLQKIFTPINDILIDNIKKGGRDKNSTPEQTLGFILSGGDYSIFAEKGENRIPETTVKNKIFRASVATPTLADIRANAQKADIPMKPGAASAESPGEPNKMSDIKSKFTI